MIFCHYLEIVWSFWAFLGFFKGFWIINLLVIFGCFLGDCLVIFLESFFILEFFLAKDKNREDATATTKFQEITEAYEAICRALEGRTSNELKNNKLKI